MDRELMEDLDEYFVCSGCKGKCSLDMESDEELLCADCFNGSWNGEDEYRSNRAQDEAEYNEMRYNECKYYANLHGGKL